MEVLVVLAIFGLLAAMGLRVRATPSASTPAALEAFLHGVFQRTANGGMDYALLVGDGPPRDPQSRRLLLASRMNGQWQRTDWEYQLPQQWRIVPVADRTVLSADRSRFPAMTVEEFAAIPGRWIAIGLPAGRPPRGPVLLALDDGTHRGIRRLRLSDYAYQPDEEQ